MNKAKKSNKPLIFSIISIMLCTILLIGATIAWFTDTETNKGNTIEAGTLDIIAQWYDVDADSGNTAYAIGDYSFTFESDPNNFAETTDSMISETNWQSGDVNAKLVEVINNGTLDVNIDLNAVATDLGLEDSLWFDFVGVDTESNTTYGTFTVRAMSSLSDVVSNYSTELKAGETVQFILIYGMLESAGNTYQADDSYTADIIVTATQTNTEEETVVYAYNVDDIKNAEADQTVILMNDITDLKADITLTKNLNFDLNGYTLMVNTFNMSTDAYCTVDFENGEIWVQTGDVDINVPNGTVNLIDATFVLPTTALNDGTANILNFTVSEHTLTTTNDIYVYNVTAATMDYIAEGVFNADNILSTTAISGTMTINGGVQAIINEGSTVHGSVISSTDEDYILIYNGTITGEITGATTEGEVEEGTSVIFTASQLYDFLTSTSTDDNKAILANDITYDTDNDGVMYISSKKDLDLNGNTISLLNDTSDDVTGGDSNSSNTSYPIKMDGGGDLTIYGGTFIAGMPDDSEETEVGAMGAIGYADYTNDAILNIYDMTFYNSYQGYACIQAYEMDTVTITDCTFYSYYGNAVKSACSNVIINNCTVYQDPDVSYGSNFFAVQWENYDPTTLTVNGGTYSGNAKGLYVYDTGGTINVTDGTFTAETVLKADNSTAGSIINVYDGTFDGGISIETGATLNLYGGTFSNTGLTLEAFSAYVADGYTATETSTGVYTVSESTDTHK